LIIKILRKIIPPHLRPVVKKLIPGYQARSVSKILKSWNRTDPSNWPLAELCEKQSLEKYEYSLFSQNGEDGILRYLFSEIGFRSKLFLEFGFGVSENNSFRLVLSEGFGGMFIDGSASTVRLFNSAARKFGLTNVKAIHIFLNLGNLEAALLGSGLPEDIDLLSIDVDGNDYWFWEGISCINPRVVIIEYNASLGSELSLTVPYDPFFDRHEKHASGFYSGASITALVRLGKKKGYVLVACDSNGLNAFFVRRDCLTQSMNVLSSRAAYRPHRRRLERGFSLEDQCSLIKDMPYIEI